LPPSLIGSTPADLDIDVARTADITLTFSEPVRLDSGAVQIQCPAGSSTFTYSGSPSAGTSATTHVINPSGSLPATTVCQITVLASKVHDTDTVDLPGFDTMMADVVFTFTTADPAPAVSLTTPADGATGVDPSKPITLRFSEDVSLDDGAVQIQCPSGSAPLAYTSSPASGTADNIHNISPVSDLPGGAVCQVTVVAAGVHDADLVDPPDGLATDYVFSFTPAGVVVRTLVSANNVGFDLSLQLDSSGRPVISYFDDSADDLKLVVCSDQTCSTTPTVRTIESSGNIGLYTSLVLVNDNPVISYVDASHTGTLKLAICANPTCSSGTTIRTIESNASAAYTTLLLNAGNPVISYYSLNGTLKLAVCNDPTCTAPTIRTVDAVAGHFVGNYAGMVLDSGRPVISYYDSTAGLLKLAICDDAVCTAPTIRTLDTVGSNGLQWYTSVVMSGGNPIISYYDTVSEDLKLAVCTDPTCTGTTIVTIDAGGSVGRFSSMKLNNGNPVISYNDKTNTWLKLAVCTDPTCSAGTILRTLDESGAGAYTSLQINNGNPVVAEQNSAAQDLKLAACNNPTCAP
jgi:methionine-rich copper-binding protein CopC